MVDGFSVELDGAPPNFRAATCYHQQRRTRLRVCMRCQCVCGESAFVVDVAGKGNLQAAQEAALAKVTHSLLPGKVSSLQLARHCAALDTPLTDACHMLIHAHCPL